MRSGPTATRAPTPPSTTRPALPARRPGEGARLRRRAGVCVEGCRGRPAVRSRPCGSRAGSRTGRAPGRRPARPLHDALEGYRRGRLRRRRSGMSWAEPLYTAEEMRAAEAAYPGATVELMERAGTAVAQEVFPLPDAERVAVCCGTGSNGGDGLLGRRARTCGQALGRAHRRLRGEDLGDLRSCSATPTSASPSSTSRRPRTSSSTRSSAPASAASRGPTRCGDRRERGRRADRRSRPPVRRRRLHGQGRGAAVQAAVTVTFHAPGRSRRRARPLPRGELVAADIGLARRRRACDVRTGDAELVPRPASATTSTRRDPCSSWAGRSGSRAPSLTSEAALRASAGIVTLCVPASLNLVFEQRLVEAGPGRARTRTGR